MVKAVDKEAVIENTRLLAKSGGKNGDFKPRSAAMADTPRQTVQRGSRATPKLIMGEVFAPRAAGGPDTRREAFRAFMTRNRLRASSWSKEAGVPMGEIMSYLTGQSRGFSAQSLARLAKAAKVAPDDMFR